MCLKMIKSVYVTDNQDKMKQKLTNITWKYNQCEPKS